MQNLTHSPGRNKRTLIAPGRTDVYSLHGSTHSVRSCHKYTLDLSDPFICCTASPRTELDDSTSPCVFALRDLNGVAIGLCVFVLPGGLTGKRAPCNRSRRQSLNAMLDDSSCGKSEALFFDPQQGLIAQLECRWALIAAARTIVA